MADARTTWTRIQRRPGARVALAVLAILVSAAVYAPLIANHRPYWLRAVDRGSYDAARESLEPVTRAWAALRSAAGDPPNAPSAGTIELELSAVRARIAALRAGLDREDQRALEPLERALADAREAEAVAAARVAADALVRRGDDGAPGMDLVSTSSSPLLRALSPLDVLAIGIWTTLLLAWVLPARARRVVPWIALPLVLTSAAAWRPLVGPERALERPIHDAIQSGDLVVERSIPAPIARGFEDTRLSEAFRRPSRAHLLGTDSVGRDLLARVLHGARVSLAVGLVSAVLLTLLGTGIGLAAGWCGGWVDFALVRAIEAVASFPALFLVLCALLFVDPRVVPPLAAVAVVIALVGWTSVARLVRAECLKLRELEFVLAARALGLSGPRIVFVHVLPNLLTPVLVAFAFAASNGILVESALSFLGFGVQAPTPSWGSIVHDSRSPEQAWIWIAPGACIFATVVAYNALGEALRDALDPKEPG